MEIAQNKTLHFGLQVNTEISQEMPIKNILIKRIKFVSSRVKRRLIFVGGSPSDHGKHPWQASIRIKTDRVNFHLCGATIITHHHVITAAHCIEHPKELYVVR